LVVAFFFLSMGQGALAEDVWRIGTIYPLTGPLSKNGIKNFDGVKIATEMINIAGACSARRWCW